MLFKTNCPYCGQKAEFDADDSGRECNCPACGRIFSLFPIKQEPIVTRPQTEEIQFAKIIKRAEFAGTGCLIQFIGLVLCFTLIGAIIGIPLLIYGGRAAIKKECSECGNRLEGKPKICPVCKSHFR